MWAYELIKISTQDVTAYQIRSVGADQQGKQVYSRDNLIPICFTGKVNSHGGLEEKTLKWIESLKMENIGKNSNIVAFYWN